MAKGKQVSFAAGAGPSTSGAQEENVYRGFAADPQQLAEVPMEPRLACSEEELGEDKELWLLQLPLDVDLSKPMRWTVDRAGGMEGLRAHCQLDGRTYEMVPEREVTSVPLYVTPREGGGRLASVSRRLTVLRTTQAPQVCFGLPADHQALSPAPLRPADEPAAAAASKKKAPKRHKLQAAPVAETIAEPRQAVPPAAAEAVPNKSNLTAYGGGHQPQPTPAVVAAPAGGDAAAESERKRKKMKDKADKRHGAGEQGGEVAEAKSEHKKKKKKEHKGRE